MAIDGIPNSGRALQQWQEARRQKNSEKISEKAISSSPCSSSSSSSSTPESSVFSAGTPSIQPCPSSPAAGFLEFKFFDGASMADSPSSIKGGGGWLQEAQQGPWFHCCDHSNDSVTIKSGGDGWLFPSPLSSLPLAMDSSSQRRSSLSSSSQSRPSLGFSVDLSQRRSCQGLAMGTAESSPPSSPCLISLLQRDSMKSPSGSWGGGHSQSFDSPFSPLSTKPIDGKTKEIISKSFIPLSKSLRHNNPIPSISRRFSGISLEEVPANTAAIAPAQGEIEYRRNPDEEAAIATLLLKNSTDFLTARGYIGEEGDWVYAFHKERLRKGGKWRNWGSKSETILIQNTLIGAMEVAIVMNPEVSLSGQLQPSFDLQFVLSGTKAGGLPSELAAIVIQTDSVVQNKKAWSGWGLKFLEKIAKSSDPASQLAPGDVTVVLPAGDHGAPKSCASWRPALIERWQLGGSCDCGGWDLGCGLTVLSTKRAERSNLMDAMAAEMGSSIKLLGAGYGLHIYQQGRNHETPILSLTYLEEGGGGHYSLSFQEDHLLPIQAFAIAIALLHSKDCMATFPDKNTVTPIPTAISMIAT